MEPERTAEERAEAKERHAMALRGIVARLDGELGHHFTRDTIEHYVDDSYDRLSASSRVLTHIPAFVERFARQRLRALARSSGIIEGHPVHVLFVCDRNDGASQMAAALFQAAVGDRGVAHSGGARPAAALLDEAVYALQEVGLDLVGEFPKPVTPEIEATADVVVTIGDHDDVPVVDGRRYVAWRMPPIDPADPLAYRRLREELHTRVTALVAEVVPPQTVRAFDRELAALETELSSMGDTGSPCSRPSPAISDASCRCWARHCTSSASPTAPSRWRPCSARVPNCPRAWTSVAGRWPRSSWT